MKETLSIGGKDEFKVIEVPSPFPPGIKTEIKNKNQMENIGYIAAIQ